GNDNLLIWVNPNLNTVPSDASASMSYISTDIVNTANTTANTAPIQPYAGAPATSGAGNGGELDFNLIRLFPRHLSGTPPVAQWLLDELRVGETFGDVTPFTSAGNPGDYDNNGKVDASDYVLWRNGGPLQNDPTPGVQDADYDFWKAHF